MKKKSNVNLWMKLSALLLMGLLLFFYREDLRDLTVDDTKYADQIREAAERYGLPPELVRAVVFQESRFNPTVIGGKGEVGLMQLLPEGAVAEWSAATGKPAPGSRELTDVRTNLNIGCWYLARAVRRWDKFDHKYELALAQYNAGESRAAKWKPEEYDGEVIDRIGIKSTRHYVSRIIKRYEYYLEKK